MRAVQSVVPFERRRGYALYIPPDYDEGVAWPVILFLHGAGERGSDGISQTQVGIGPALERRSTPLPAFVVFPQCPRQDQWVGGGRALALAALEATGQEFHIDAKRVALTGISMGGAGAWLLAVQNPQRFSALSPICGWLGHDAMATLSGIASVPTWVFHGDADDIVPVDSSRTVVTALEAAGGYVRYTEYRGVGHNSWDKAYQETDVIDWLISPQSSVVSP